MTREKERLQRLDSAAALLGILAFVMLVLRYGFPNLPLPRSFIFLWSAILPVGMFLESLYRLLWVRDPWHYLLVHPLRYLILLMILLELSGVAAWSSGSFLPRSNASLIAGELYLAVFLFAFAGSWAKGAIQANRWLANRHVPVLSLPALTFIVAIFAGTILLSFPGMNRIPVSLLDALFTTTSAVCVTGLTVYDVSSALTPAGKTVLTLLIQLGGIGTLTVMGMLALWYGGHLTIGERVAFFELVGGSQLRQTRKLIATVVRVTLAVEFLGAVTLWLLWRGQVPHPLLYGIFHAVSAFCNAGFSIFPGSLARFAGDYLVLLVFMMLIIVGGAGFPIVANLWKVSISRVVPWSKPVPFRHGARVALWWSGLLIITGALGFWADGWWAGAPRNIVLALFQSVTTRTAGFQVESQLHFGIIGLVFAFILMIIGASPQSTGGGIKTTVIARLFSKVDPMDPDAPPKKLLFFKPFRIALLLVSTYLSIGLISGLLLKIIEEIPAADAFFEAFSALGTVGLSRDVTPRLSVFGKILLIALMFTGRVLYATLVIRVVRARRPSPDAVEWA